MFYMVRYSMVWYGMVWYGMVWDGVVGDGVHCSSYQTFPAQPPAHVTSPAGSCPQRLLTILVPHMEQWNFGSTQLWNIFFVIAPQLYSFPNLRSIPRRGLGSFDRFLSKTKQTPVKDSNIWWRLNTWFQQTEWMRDNSLRSWPTFFGGKRQRINTKDLKPDFGLKFWNKWMASLDEMQSQGWQFSCLTIESQAKRLSDCVCLVCHTRPAARCQINPFPPTHIWRHTWLSMDLYGPIRRSLSFQRWS